MKLDPTLPHPCACLHLARPLSSANWHNYRVVDGHVRRGLNMNYCALTVAISSEHPLALVLYGKFCQPISQTSSYTINLFVGMYRDMFTTSIFYLTKKRHTSWNTMTKLITFANVLIFLLATAANAQRTFLVPALSAGIWV